MTTRIALFLGAFLALFGSSRVNAMVYVLQRGYSLRDVRGLVKAKSVLKDKVTVNGVEGDMEVFLSPMKLSDALAALKPALRKNKNVLGTGTVVIDVPDGKWINRLLLLKAGTKSKVVLFQMRLPANDRGDTPDGSWPSRLPKPSGARIDRVMQLKKSGASFCQFSTAGTASFVEGYNNALKADGWTPLSSDSSKGSAYLSEKKDYMLILSTWKDKKKSSGSVFLRRIKTLPIK
jgi:hypothetical protein